MTKKQAEQNFIKDFLPAIPKNDKSALRMWWNDYVALLCEGGQITAKQYKTWTQPRFISG